MTTMEERAFTAGLVVKAGLAWNRGARAPGRLDLNKLVLKALLLWNCDPLLCFVAYIPGGSAGTIPGQGRAKHWSQGSKGRNFGCLDMRICGF
jgi:hypothetical protein